MIKLVKFFWSPGITEFASSRHLFVILYDPALHLYFETIMDCSKIH